MKIDINCDVGEGIKNEHLLMPHISSCNIACGGHFGNAKTIEETLKIAIRNNVKVGAHPSFPDKENFGRKLMTISNSKLMESLQYQIDTFIEVLNKYNIKMHHIKPHGALYNAIAKDIELAKVFLEAIEKYLDDVFLFVPYKSVFADLCKQRNIKIKYEVFADRSYNNDYSLVSRSESNAILIHEKDVLNHVLLMVQNDKVKTITQSELVIKADTFCIHGDTKNAQKILEFLSLELPKKGIFLDK